MLDKFSEENLRVEFDRIRAERKAAGEKAKAAAEKPFQIEASKLFWAAYTEGMTKDEIFTAARAYANQSRRKEIEDAWQPETIPTDLRSRNKTRKG